jgi:hypothetical protein
MKEENEERESQRTRTSRSDHQANIMASNKQASKSNLSKAPRQLFRVFSSWS